MKMKMPSGVSVIEGGTDGFRLLNIITEADRLIVIDTVKGGADPGSIYGLISRGKSKDPEDH